MTALAAVTDRAAAALTPALAPERAAALIAAADRWEDLTGLCDDRTRRRCPACQERHEWERGHR